MRDCIELANQTQSSTIIFAVSGVITLISPLPYISQHNTTIDGGNDITISIDCNEFSGLIIDANYCMLNCISIYNSSKYSLKIKGNNNSITGCYFGFDFNGIKKFSKDNGIVLDLYTNNNIIGSNHNHISGYTSNIIGNYSKNGIYAIKSNTNSIQNNYIGICPDRVSRASCEENVIYLYKCNEWYIGGDVFINSNGEVNNPTGSKGLIPPTFVKPLLGNTISGNKKHGIFCEKCSNFTFQGNFIGTDYTGNISCENHENGIYINKCSYMNIQGCYLNNPPFVFYNILSGNGKNGLDVNDSNYTTIQGNFFVFLPIIICL